ncbi:hypothetical protein KTQ42_12530|uniref:hypothetical protein n=1 Tax=Noviherbaspirillum sp. L7-7A TaxID=2850560 RepID=UPI001C2BAE9E|nr:hypothetical protein [Noviherbaspirillum sp. L7-7A]MBV0880128.1 hypothetical protein [Noviherbaspirillum sp. L7-7A]
MEYPEGAFHHGSIKGLADNAVAVCERPAMPSGIAPCKCGCSSNCNDNAIRFIALQWLSLLPIFDRLAFCRPIHHERLPEILQGHHRPCATLGSHFLADRPSKLLIA